MTCSSSTTRWCSAWSCRATVNAAINRKIEQYYLVQEYGFRVEREKKESERKQIEANGIRDFQQTVTQGISDSYVRWRGIEATLQLAQSPNTKIVIIGSGKDGLPVILGNVDTPMQPNPATPAGAARRPSPTTAKRHGKSRQARARRSWKRRRPAICRARPNGRRRPRCRARPDRRRLRRECRRRTARPARRQASSRTGRPREPRSSWTWSELQDLISRTVGSGDRRAPDSPPPPMAGTGARHQAAGEPPRPAPGPAPSRQAEGRRGRRLQIAEQPRPPERSR